MDWLSDTTSPLSDEEKRFLEKLAQTDPTSPPLLRLAQEHLNQSRADLALEIIGPVVEAHPYFLGAAVIMARALADNGQTDEAEHVMERPALAPLTLAEWLRRASETWEYIGNKEQAKRFLTVSQVLKAEGDVESLFEETETAGGAVPTITLARLYMEQGYTDRAIKVCNQILSKTPDHPQALELLRQLTGPAEDEAGIPEDLTVESTGAPTDYSAIRVQKEAQLLAEDDGEKVSPESKETDYSAIMAMAEEEEIEESEALEDFEQAALDIPEEKVMTDYSAVQAADETHDLEDLVVPEEAALTDYTAIHALQEEGELPEPEAETEEDLTLPEPEDEVTEADDLEGLDIPEETVSTDYSAVKAAEEDHDLEGLEVPEEAGLTDYTAIRAMEEEEEGLPEPDEEFSLPEPEDEELAIDDDAIQSLEAEELRLPEPEIEADEDLILPEPQDEELAIDDDAIQSLEAEEPGLPEPEVAADDDLTLPEPQDEELEADETGLEILETELLSDEELAIDDDAIKSMEAEEQELPEPEIAADDDLTLPEDEELEDEEFSLEASEDELSDDELMTGDEVIQTLEEQSPGLPEPEAGELEDEDFSLDVSEEELLTDDDSIQALEAADDVPMPGDPDWQLDDEAQEESEFEPDWDSDQLQPPQSTEDGGTDYDSIEDLGDVLDEATDRMENDPARAKRTKIAERLGKMRDAAARRRQRLEEEQS